MSGSKERPSQDTRVHITHRLLQTLNEIAIAHGTSLREEIQRVAQRTESPAKRPRPTRKDK